MINIYTKLINIFKKIINYQNNYFYQKDISKTYRMSQVQIEFAYDGTNTFIQCSKNDKMKDIYQSFKSKAQVEGKNLIYMYNGKTIENKELTFNDIANSQDKNRNKMNILVIEGEETIAPQAECIIKSNKIICPECQEDIKFSIEDYKISLFECKNKHEINNIFLDELDSTQNIKYFENNMSNLWSI